MGGTAGGSRRGSKNKVLSSLMREVPQPVRRTVLTRCSSTYLSHTLDIVSQTLFFVVDSDKMSRATLWYKDLPDGIVSLSITF